MHFFVIVEDPVKGEAWLPGRGNLNLQIFSFSEVSNVVKKTGSVSFGRQWIFFFYPKTFMLRLCKVRSAAA